jgi:hypothetical protein
METDLTVTNGDGTISYCGMNEVQARRRAQELADTHGEPFEVLTHTSEDEEAQVLAVYEPSA